MRLPVVLVVLSASLLCGAARGADLYGGDLALVRSELQAPEAARRRDAVEKLQAYRADEARPLLEAALGDSDVEVRVRAATSLGRLKVVASAEKLVALLGDGEPRMRAAAAEALGHLAEAGGFGGLDDPASLSGRVLSALERALGDGEHEVREAAVVALGRLPRSLALHATVPLAARLDDESAGVRQRAAEVLAELGDARAVLPLIGRLQDASRDVRMAALVALARTGDARAATAMIRLLRDPAEEVRATAVQALGRLGAPAAVPALEALLQRRNDPLAGRALFALAQLMGKEADSRPGGADSRQPTADSRGLNPAAVGLLVGALEREDLRGAARQAIGQLGAAAVPALVARLGAPSPGDAGMLVDLLGELHAPGATPALVAELSRGRLARERVIDALGALAHAGDPAAVLALTALYADRDVAIRRRAARALTGAADARAISALADGSADRDPEVRRLAIVELGRLGATRAVPPLITALAASDDDTAAAAARALGLVGDRRAARPLLEALARGQRVARESADALGRLADPATLAPLLQLARTGAPDTRVAALTALTGVARKRRDPVVRELALEYAEGKDAPLTLAALDLLAASGDPMAVPRLLRLLDRTADAATRRATVQALGASGSSGDDVLHALGHRLETDPDFRVRAEAAWALGKIGRDHPALARALLSPSAAIRTNAAAAFARLGRAPDPLSRLLDDPEPAVRANAALALSRTPTAVDALRRLAAADPDTAVRTVAARAAKGAVPSTPDEWISLYMLDFDGAPLADARYSLHLPDGLVKAGATDFRGVAREEPVPHGDCQVQLASSPPPPAL